ncbi:MAG: cbb3-type cytochrome c oxidase subunit 3 [Polyangiaceae bacterium]
MRLSDIMSAMQLHSWAELALLVFLAAFAAIVVHLLSPKRRAEFERAGRLPLDDSEFEEADKTEGTRDHG